MSKTQISLNHPGWYSFKNGVKVSNGEVEKWVNDVFESLQDKATGTSSSCSSGDTVVFGKVWKDNIDIVVARGYTNLTIFRDEETGEWQLDEKYYYESAEDDKKELTIEERLDKIEETLQKVLERY